MIHPDIHRFLVDWDAAWAMLAPGAGPAARRGHFEGVAAAMREPHPPGIGTREHHVPVPETGTTVRVREFRPQGATAALPALVYLHGGAWMQGSPETHWDITAGFAALNQQAVFSVDYALAPEQPFPRALHETLAVARWVHDHAAALGLRADAIAIGGDSAGGNLAAAATLELRGTPQAPRAQLLIYPATEFTLDRPSHRENANGPLVTVASMPMVNAMYCPDTSLHLTPPVSPLRAASHAGLPPAFVAVAQHDPLRDEGMAYAEALQAAGVAVELDRGEALIHGYLRAKAYCAPARERFERMAAWLQSTLA
ncbi:alpha/beta hydrolase [Hydrogenophaga sp. NFH-34]|uniref:alpha/beta hydrolase n=1 Tax=Hydrogenophaga sp. NFH-34 TaxID=2744446 RepID=UPI001F23E9B0|nr:alpha/beta hydrolase [Hydrogenophaga sp. NFH-34]